MSISDACGSVLREELRADRNIPPFHRVAMDGFAFARSALLEGQRKFAVEGQQRAGVPPRKLTNPHNAIQVMTGAVLPDGADCVLRIEDLEVSGGVVFVSDSLAQEIEPYMHVHQEGSDHKTGALLLKPFTTLLSPQIAVAASIGKGLLKVTRPPRIALVSTGDELVDIDQVPDVHQIRRSNIPAIFACLKTLHFHNIEQFHFRDDREVIFEGLGSIVKSFDYLILSGGVSMGEYDFLPEVLKELQVSEIFHKVRQRPGKPMWFGKFSEAVHTALVFGLPGNPVSTLISFHRYVVPSLNQYMGRPPDQPMGAFLTEEIGFGKSLTYFLPVRINKDHLGQLHATPVWGNGSGDYSSLSHSDGFIELEETQSIFQAGKAYPFHPWS